MARTYLYKLTSDRGGAPCALEPPAGETALLTLAICKPAIRRTAQPGDRIVGITSHALARRDGYPLLAVIYAAVVGEGIEARDYFDVRAEFVSRPDCIYRFHHAVPLAQGLRSRTQQRKPRRNRYRLIAKVAEIAACQHTSIPVVRIAAKVFAQVSLAPVQA